MFKRLDEDERFGPLIRSIQEELLELTGAWLRDDIVVGRGTLLVASPGRITSYHMDSDINFLFQIKGKKTFNVTEAGERGAVSQQELEHFFLGDPNAAHYDEARQQRSTVYELGAGDGVHVPCLSPHWAQNHDSPSVALSINFDLRSIVSVGRIYRLNGRLRRWWLMPYPPRVSQWRDQLKLAALNALHHRPSRGCTMQRGLKEWFPDVSGLLSLELAADTRGECLDREPLGQRFDQCDVGDGAVNAQRSQRNIFGRAVPLVQRFSVRKLHQNECARPCAFEHDNRSLGEPSATVGSDRGLDLIEI